MKLKILLFSLLLLIIESNFAQNNYDEIKTTNGVLKIYPIQHASLVLSHNNKIIIVDPNENSEFYKNFKSPDIILITDIHGDHLNLETLDKIDTSKSIFIVPNAVAEKLPSKYNSKIIVLKNKQGIHRFNYFIQAVPMYNLPEESNSKHPKGRGNGYILNIDNKRIYISGDTEDTTEMRSLQNIDIAFVCMNLPYTMDIYQASSAVLEFQPKIVYPYHYRGKDGLSDVKKFKEMVNSKNSNIKVNLRDWYGTN
ncbi:MBL fold metallo-hydrolase [Lutibacter citreus]|uniref:MBL fold metallo-hydrolase n=1 Tax=Lutibacter citreus TaxID=2138210 RepID=UPI000DBE3B6E|nr:MBL fold metallo-hydrolase [Lutibacter citreus]